MLRPFFKHYGGKWRLSGKVPGPHYDTIVEPFAGGAGYSLRYGAGRRVMLYDTDPDTCAIWQWLLKATPERVLRLPVQPIHERADVRELGLERAEMLLIQRWLTAQGSTTNWRMTPGRIAWVTRKPGSVWSKQTRQRIADQLPALRDWHIECAPYSDAPDIEATWHVDPPYQCNTKATAVYGDADFDFAALGAWCRTRRGQVMVHEQHGADWLPFATLDAQSAGGRASPVEGRCRQHEVWWRQG